MRMRKIAAAAALGFAAAALSGCATGLNTQVSRYQAAAVAPGQSFYVLPEQGTPSPEFYRYASMVSEQLAAQGFKPAGAPQVADLLVKLDYGVDGGTTELARDYTARYRNGGLGWYDPFHGPYWGSGYYGRPYYSRWGGYPFYYGWGDPFYGSGYGLRERTVFKSFLNMNIVRRVDSASLFEGHAQARSRTNEMNELVPSLVTAMFTGFPGQSGETVKITVPSRKN